MENKKYIRSISIILLNLTILNACSNSEVKLNMIENRPSPIVDEIKDSKNLLKRDNNGYYQWCSSDLSSYDLSDITFNDFYDKTFFNTKTNWSQQFKNKFHPENLIESGKSPYYHISDVHKKGITGKNVNIAIIGSPFLIEHKDLNNQIKGYLGNDLKIEDNSGILTVSIIAAKHFGIAPDSNIYYIVDTPVNSNKGIDFTSIADDIDFIIGYNEESTNKNKIRIIAIPYSYFKKNMPMAKKTDGADAMNDAIERAKKNGITVIVSSVGGDETNIIGISRTYDQDENKMTKFISVNNEKSFVYVPTYGITIPSNTGVKEYEYIPPAKVINGDIVPYLTGLYALALDVNPNISWEEFITKAEKSYTKIDDKKIMDPLKLIMELENQ